MSHKILNIMDENKQILIIGDNNNRIREYVTINPGTVGGGGKTSDWKQLFINDIISHSCT